MDSRSDYILFISQRVDSMPISDKFKNILREIAVNGFDDGFAMHRDGGLEADKYKEFKNG